MSQIVSFSDYTPPARYDGVAWATIRVQEASTNTGPWTLIDTLTLSPVDADPTTPASRNLTTDQASDTADLWYRLVPVDGSANTGAASVPVQNVTAEANNYITRNEVKVAAALSSLDYADDDIDRACTSVSRALDLVCRGRDSHFYQVTETRYFTPGEFNCSYGPYDTRLEIPDLTSVSSVTVDTAGDGSYSTTWTEGTDFYLDPPNAASRSWPFEELVLRRVKGQVFPDVQRAIKITGTWGWPFVPIEISQYALIYVTQMVIRTRQAPLGILTASLESGGGVRISRMDPDFERMCGPFVRQRLFV